MLNVRAPNGEQIREDFPIFSATNDVSKPAGVYYFGQCGLVDDTAKAAKLDIQGQRSLRGLKVVAGRDISPTTIITITPMLSADSGDTYSELPTLQASLAPANRRRAQTFISAYAAFVSVPDNSLLIFKALLTKNVTNMFLTITLLAY